MPLALQPDALTVRWATEDGDADVNNIGSLKILAIVSLARAGCSASE
jgi:hypothetical protein